MPIEISLPFEPNKIEKAIEYWLDLLRREDYAEAYNLTMHDPYYEWTPALIESYINGYGLPYEEGETVYKVTDWRTAHTDNNRPAMDIFLFDAHRISGNGEYKVIGYVQYDIPLNGERSDLTVTFSIMQAEDYIRLELNDIHVL
ncbi:MAG TPA: hypothetical protein VG738_16400 [Chitinophagaceae bacterium]|nr:hypothetical protein [Chitinophagaceae bacterium]